MFESAELKAHLQNSSTISSEAVVVAEWNMNISNNIFKVGNYRYRPTSTTKYRTLANSFDEYDDGNFYTGATDADTIIDGGIADNNTPITFTSKKDKEKLLYSLEDCFGRFRPRSGINKLRYFEANYSHFDNQDMASRPRYYIADKDDKFKYWTSYRTEDGIERGIANTALGNTNTYQIEDAAPFIVYKDPVPANRIVVKMQTNVGTVDLGPFYGATDTIPDPFYGVANQTTPVKWKIQYLDNNSWTDAITFDSNSLRSDGRPVIGPDGYVEVAYGLLIPEVYANIFVEAETVASSYLLPQENRVGYAYLVKESSTDIGTIYIWTGEEYETFAPEYGWYLVDDYASDFVSNVTQLVSPDSFISQVDSKTKFREFSYVGGLRIVVETMNKFDSTFDLIELSPRLAVNMVDRTIDFQLNKNASDLGVSGLPVGQLLASTGSIRIFDFDQAFNQNNTQSIVSKYLTQNLQIKFYEAIKNVNAITYYVPIKTMYAEGFPEIDTASREVTISLRDLFFYLESMTAPQILLQNVSVSYAISLLLDSVGFSNYVFKRIDGEKEMIIPFFFIPPDKSVAQLLNEIAVSTQSAMFFDEYNNFVVMSKNYIMPSLSQRPTDFVLSGSKDQQASGIISNQTIPNKTIANIVDISSQENIIYNDGRITYTTRAIQKSAGTIKQASMIDRDRSWVYKPVLLWEVAGEDATKSINGEVDKQSEYMLSAIPLNSRLTADLPSVSNFKVINNTIDLGEGVYWITRYNGYFYANGEIIRYDAVQFSIPNISEIDPDNPNIEGNTVWISSVQEYQTYFNKLPFNGKIYPTGLIRIYSEPNYEVVTADGSIISSTDILPPGASVRLKNGPVAKHGRGQFGTTPTAHEAGLAQYWTADSSIRGCTMESKYLFAGASTSGLTLTNAAAGTTNDVSGKTSNALALNSTRNGLSKNFLTSYYVEESGINQQYSTQSGTVQSSAFIFNGPAIANRYEPLNFVSYVYKPLGNKYSHFGSRVRIIGKPENSDKRDQTPVGAVNYYVASVTEPNKNVVVGGASGGIAVMVNPETNVGYYFEIAALTQGNFQAFDTSNEDFHNVYFYKVMKNSTTSAAIPVKLWGGLESILVDDGNFTTQYRFAGEENPTVYDLSVEYQDIGSVRTFFLYINNKLVATVEDKSPLPVYNNMAMFVRGASRLMFENLYAIAPNYAQNSVNTESTPINTITADEEESSAESFRKYGVNAAIKSIYLSGISVAEPPKYRMYYEEFGTIMREVAYIKARYDKAYPALLAKLSPTFNRIKGYTVAGFLAGSYAAEMLVFNTTDAPLSLDSQTGNYLRIQGVTFTQESSNELSVDDFYKKRSDFSDPQLIDNTRVISPQVSKREYQDIKNSRITYGRNEFSIAAPYIQSHDDANDMMSWIMSKIAIPRKSVGANIFSTPILQLGDVVEVDYVDQNGVRIVSAPNSRFVVYSTEYSRSVNGPEMTVYLSEVR